MVIELCTEYYTNVTNFTAPDAHAQQKNSRTGENILITVCQILIY